MPRAPITYQPRPQKWTEDDLSDALNSFQYGILLALNLINEDDSTLILPGFTFTPPPNTPSAILNNTVNHGEPYPDPSHRKWLRNRGRLAVAATSFVNRGIWPTPIITASVLRTGTDLSMSPKAALAMLGLTAPVDLKAITETGLTPHQDNVARALGMKYEDHGIRTSHDRKLPSDPVREMIRLGRNNPGDLPPFAVRAIKVPLRSLLNPNPPNPGEHHSVRKPVPAHWLYETSLLTGVPVISFVRYAEHDFRSRGTTYMSEDTLVDLIGIMYEEAPIQQAEELEQTKWKLPEGDYW